MATVVDRGNQRSVDKKYASINRKVTGPVAESVVPLYAGERVLGDDGQAYVARGMTASDWQQLYQDF